jgi:S-(hydroxymethyl)glutathione dehydrogenase/alcohol dehydrogenase
VEGVRGAVWDGERLVVTDELEVRDPEPGEARVRVLASGICHSDLNVMDGTSPLPPPVVLGHEGAGVVEELGPAVDSRVGSVAVGDAVVIGSMTPCGRCRACLAGRFGDCPDAFGRGATPFRWHDAPVRAYANVSSFASMVTVQASQLVRTDELQPTSAALIGCAVSTGFGVVRNVARVAAGDTVVVFGVGGIGVNALQTARLAGCARAVAVDVNPAKEAIARRFGATDFVVADRDAPGAELAETVRAAIGTDVAPAVDATIECSGAVAAIEAAIELTAPGGTAALVGIPRAGTRVAFDVSALLRGRRIVGSLNGAIDPRRDLPEIVRLARSGALDLDAQVSHVWPLAEIDAAVAAVRAGEVVRAVLDHTM